MQEAFPARAEMLRELIEAVTTRPTTDALHALINAGGRSTVRGEMYTRDGKLCLSIAQELLIRPTSEPPTPWPPPPP